MRASWLWLLLLLVGCGSGPNQLQGSAHEDYDLRFEEVQAGWLVDDFVIRFLRGQGRGGTEPVRLTLSGADLRIDEELPAARFRVEHFVAVRNPDGSVSEEAPFPPAESGWLRLAALGEGPGAPVRGAFSLHFQGGRTLGGTFEAQLR